MDRLFEAHVFATGNEMGADHLTVCFKIEPQPDRIGQAADEARARMRKRFHAAIVEPQVRCVEREKQAPS